MASDAAYYRLALRVFSDFSATIALPAVLAALGGLWLDKRFDTNPRYLIVCLTIAFVLTAYSIVKKSDHYAKAYKKLIDDEQKEKPL